jgi:LysR family hydrogen peroxide-inducible transcriptional activator
MELRELRYLVQIAKSGSLSKASEELFIAQPSLSSFLKKYEKNLGYTLFIRTSKGLFPTAEGEIFLDYAREVLERKRRLMNQLSDLSNLKMGHIKFSISPYRAPYILPSLLVAWKQLYPNVKVEVIEANIPKQEELLRNNAVDVGFMINNNEENGILYRNITEEELLIGAHPSFELKKKAHKSSNKNLPWLDLKDIKSEPYLLYSVNHHLNKFASSIFNEYHFKPKIVQTQDNFETILKLAENGMGITFVPHTYANFHETLEYYSIGKNGRHRILALGYPPSGYLSNATVAFSNLILKHFAIDLLLL